MTDALRTLADRLREEDTPISPHVVEPDADAAFAAPEAYAPVVESVREGYLLHYGESRVLAGHEGDLGLLAGDYLYALGIERLAAMGDARAVGVLAELIGRCAQLHAEGREGEAAALWREAVAALGR